MTDTTPAAEPVVLRVTRYRCPFCTHARAAKAATIAHIGRCWNNPAARACKTCLFYDYEPTGERCFPEYPCNCNEGWERCHAPAEINLTDGLKINCPLWQPRKDAR